ncbi:HNH endonuclease signature motif containing protein [Kitasatospora sp. NPDC094016]|uniref:HNH endonuclease signature motif containing protein n=1 Tax=Kitasatospora sp. NPDC094016 TaxID=3154986 RepID=UPI0033310BB9
MVSPYSPEGRRQQLLGHYMRAVAARLVGATTDETQAVIVGRAADLIVSSTDAELPVVTVRLTPSGRDSEAVRSAMAVLQADGYAIARRVGATLQWGPDEVVARAPEHIRGWRYLNGSSRNKGVVVSAAVDWAVNVAKGLRRFVLAPLPPVAEEPASALDQQASAPFTFAIPVATGRAAAVHEAEVARIAMRREFLATVAARVNGGTMTSPQSVTVWVPNGFAMHVNAYNGTTGKPSVSAYLARDGRPTAPQLEVMAALRKDVQSAAELIGTELSWNPERQFSVWAHCPVPAVARYPDGSEAVADDAIDWAVRTVEGIQRHLLGPIEAGTLGYPRPPSPGSRPTLHGEPGGPSPTVPAQLPTPPEAPPAGRYGPAAVLLGAGDYRAKTTALEYAQTGRSRRRRAAVVLRPVRSPVARALVVARSEHSCENPACLSPGFRAMTDDGDPIVEVDHITGLADGGEDHPANMIALCPNCHALKTRGQGRDAMQESLRQVARARHAEAMEGRLGIVQASP